MEFKSLQKKVDNWINEHGVRYFDPLTNMAQLTEEVGEVARVISRRFGEQSEKESDKKIDLGEELSDVLFVVLCLANQTGIDLDNSFNKLIQFKDRVQYVICGFDTRGTITEINGQTGEQKKRQILPHETVWARYEEIFTQNYKVVSEDFKNHQREQIENTFFGTEYKENYLTLASLGNIFNLNYKKFDNYEDIVNLLIKNKIVGGSKNNSFYHKKYTFETKL